MSQKIHSRKLEQWGNAIATAAANNPMASVKEILKKAGNNYKSSKPKYKKMKK